MLKGVLLIFGVLLFCCDFVYAIPLEEKIIPRNVSDILINTRRILLGKEVGETRPYMVYIRPAPNGAKTINDSTWLCGGVIIHERYVLTSAACIEQAEHFYVISGTSKWTPTTESNDCIEYGAKKAIWKCVPKNYVYDGNEYDNIRWMIGDIAVVKVEDNFNFQRRVKGCDYIPKQIAFNNLSLEYEKAGSIASTAGWGSQDAFSDDLTMAAAMNSEKLLETDVMIIGKNMCKKRWPERYHYIIDRHMICGKDGHDTDTMSSVCMENEVNCKELTYSDEEDNEEDLRRFNKNTQNMPRLVVDPENNNLTATRIGRRAKSHHAILASGFCENDHGGPLVVGHGMTSIVVGVISACQTSINHKCFGPFLYTSVYRYRSLISCAIDKDVGETCRKYMRTTVKTSFKWDNHPDGPAKDIMDEEGSVKDEGEIVNADDRVKQPVVRSVVDSNETSQNNDARMKKESNA